MEGELILLYVVDNVRWSSIVQRRSHFGSHFVLEADSRCHVEIVSLSHGKRPHQDNP